VRLYGDVDVNGEPVGPESLIFTSGAPNTTVRLLELHDNAEGIYIYKYTVPFESFASVIDHDRENADSRNFMKVSIVDVIGGADMEDFEWNWDDNSVLVELHAVTAPPASEVTSFAPALVAVVLALLIGAVFCTLYTSSGGKDPYKKDEDAVSPVIAIILMVAITIVLAGVLWLWVSDLVDTGKTSDIHHVDVEWQVPNAQNDYQLRIKNVEDSVLSVEDLRYTLYDANMIDRSQGQHKVTAIYGKSIDNETIVSFVDGDHDGYLSIGDVFLIKSLDHVNYDGNADPGPAMAGYVFELKTLSGKLFEKEFEQ